MLRKNRVAVELHHINWIKRIIDTAVICRLVITNQNGAVLALEDGICFAGKQYIFCELHSKLRFVWRRDVSHKLSKIREPWGCHLLFVKPPMYDSFEVEIEIRKDPRECAEWHI